MGAEAEEPGFIPIVISSLHLERLLEGLRESSATVWRAWKMQSRSSLAPKWHHKRHAPVAQGIEHRFPKLIHRVALCGKMHQIIGNSGPSIPSLASYRRIRHQSGTRNDPRTLGLVAPRADVWISKPGRNYPGLPRRKRPWVERRVNSNVPSIRLSSDARGTLSRC